MSDARGDETKAEVNKWVSLRGLAETIRQPRVVAVLWVIAILHLGSFLARLAVREKGLDFNIYYTASFALAKGINPYTANLSPTASSLNWIQVSHPRHTRISLAL